MANYKMDYPGANGSTDRGARFELQYLAGMREPSRA
jgi:hypothetical protein